MSLDSKLRATDPARLATARSLVHKAVQLLTKAARANLNAVPDDSHSNLGWDPANQRFTTHPLPSGDSMIVVTLSMTPLSIELIRDGEAVATGPLVGETPETALSWLDGQLSKNGLHPASEIKLPYELPSEVEAIGVFYPKDIHAELDALASWHDLAVQMLDRFVESHAALKPGPVRCWPHHFDIASYVQLENGDFETAKGIGIGMSPGDQSYDQPYFYINPWPHLNPEKLPEAPVPGHWHTKGFVGAIGTGEEVLSLDEIERGLYRFVNSAFEIGRAQLGA